MKTRRTTSSTIVVAMELGLLILFSSCTLFWEYWRGNDEPSRLSRGSSVLSHRGKLYFLGGKTPTGEYSDTVSMALPGEDGSLLSWSPQTPLPGARAFHSTAAYGEYLYLIGGEDESGYLDEVWYTYVSPDGSLGSKWTKSSFSLPESRSQAGSFIVDGRIYLAGGEGSGGASDELLSARIWRDGRLGLWAPSSKKLPSARSGAAALHMGDKVYLAGGQSSSSFLSDFLVSEISGTGVLGDWNNGPPLPDRRTFAALVPDGDYLAILGGEGETGYQSSAYTLGAGEVWERKPVFDGLQTGGQAAVLRGFAYLPQSTALSGINDDANVRLAALSKKNTDPPTAKPAGGLVNKASSVALFAATDETIRYTLATGGAEPTDPDENSAKYDSASRPLIGVDTILKARSFAPGLEASEITRLRFIVDSTSLVYTIGKTLSPASGCRDGILQEIYSDGSTAPTKAVWYALSVTDHGWYSISIRDKDDDEVTYSDSVHVTLFEGSVLSLLHDSMDTNIYKRQDDLAVYLAPGTYYLRIGSVSGALGGSFGLCFETNPLSWQ